MWLILATSCVTVAEDDGLVAWSGWVYSDPETSDETRLVEGTVSVCTEPFATEEQYAAEQPYDDYLGYWEVRVRPGVPVNVVVQPVEGRRTLWAGDTPTSTGNWFSGSLFSAGDVWLDSVLEMLTDEGDDWLARLDAGLVLVLGAPGNALVGCEDLLVTAEGGIPSIPACWALNEDLEPVRVEAGPVEWFLALVPPGEVSVGIGTSAERYRAEAGDVVMPWYLTGGEK